MAYLRPPRPPPPILAPPPPPILAPPPPPILAPLPALAPADAPALAAPPMEDPALAAPLLALTAPEYAPDLTAPVPTLGVLERGTV